MPDPAVLAVATALPPHRITQDDAKEWVRAAFPALPGVDRLLGVFDRCGVEQRYLALSPQDYAARRPFGARNDDFIRIGAALGKEALEKALGEAGIGPGNLDILIFTTTTGLSTPSLDALLAADLGLRDGVRRIPLFGLGCAGGAAGITLAAHLLRGAPRARAAVVSVELCSLTLLLGDQTKVNLVGTALFGDGAGCAILAGGATGHEGIRVTAWESVLFPESSRLMGWGFSEEGFRLLLSPEVPAFLAEALPPRVHDFLGRQGLDLQAVRHFALHPGGRQVLEAYRRGLGLSEDALAPTREALRRSGNLSSASVFFSLKEILTTSRPAAGDLGLLAAVGPGFGAEMALLEW